MEKQNKVVEYDSNGNNVKLSMQIVRDYLVKGSAAVTDREVVSFINLCRYRQLNPFLNDAYLVKYGDSPASLVTSKEAYFKIAESCPGYSGFRAGIITATEDGIIEEREGTFSPPTEKVVGGWARVFRSDRTEPIYASVNFAEYSTGRSLWQQKPATMIRKVAIVQALREAFPIQLGAMYTAEEQRVDEQQRKDVDVFELELKNNYERKKVAEQHADDGLTLEDLKERTTFIDMTKNENENEK